MSDQEFDKKLATVVGEIGAIPQAAGPMIRAAQERAEAMARTAAALHESLASLRLSVKYLVFDLEATRRENQALRRALAAAAGEAGDEPARDH